MKENKLPFSLSQISLNVPNHDFRPTRTNLSKMVFDQRHDFILTLPSPMLSVRMVFANERYLSGKSGKGVKRSVSVTLTDVENGRLHAATAVPVCIKGGNFSNTAFVCLPIDFDNLDFSHPYKVTVRDQKSGEILGNRELHFFRQFYGSSYAAEILKPEYAGVEPVFSENLYKSFDADLWTYHSVRFHLVAENLVIRPNFIPEMEVRIYFPDGTLESKFTTPVMDENDVESNLYRVSVPIYMTPQKKGLCYSELICFDIPIAGIVFDTNGETIYGSWYAPYLDPFDEYSLRDTTERFKNTIHKCDNEKSESITDDDFEKALEEFISSQQETGDTTDEDKGKMDDLIEENSQQVVEESVSTLKALEDLTGLQSVKEKLKAYENLVLFNKKRQQWNLPILKLPLHAMFWGSPGTGKTTVAKRMGLMLRRAGVLSKGHVVFKERATLLGPYYSNEETNTQAAINEAQGGILFIDEAYQLYQPNDPRDPGKFVIEALMTALADESRRDWMLILAGYTDEMKKMFAMNPGLRSRIPESNIYVFDDFSENELMEIAIRYIERNNYSLTEEAKTALSIRLGDDFRNRDRSFGNGRHVINMIQTEILPSMALRVMSAGNVDAQSLSLIHSCDIPKSKRLVQANRPKIGYRA